MNKLSSICIINRSNIYSLIHWIFDVWTDLWTQLFAISEFYIEIMEYNWLRENEDKRRFDNDKNEIIESKDVYRDSSDEESSEFV